MFGLTACSDYSTAERLTMSECLNGDNKRLCECVVPKYLTRLTEYEIRAIVNGQMRPNIGGIMFYAPECWKYSDYAKYS